MGVYVDEVREWPTNIQCFKGGSCHLTADSVDELHAFARKLRLKREWYQPKSSPHYDLTPRKRDLALKNGARFVPAKQQAWQRMKQRGLL